MQWNLHLHFTVVNNEKILSEGTMPDYITDETFSKDHVFGFGQHIVTKVADDKDVITIIFWWFLTCSRWKFVASRLLN